MSASLPADSEIEGNVWCESCQQSLNASRANAHLVSKKHADNQLVDFGAEAKPAKKTTGVKAAAPRKAAPAPEEAPKKRVTKKKTETAEEPLDSVAPKKRVAKPVVKKVAVVEEYSDEEPLEDARRKPVKKPATKAAPAAPRRGANALSPDPEKEGNYWCGLCEVSLTPSKADAHLETKRHQDNALRTVNNAMRSTKIADDDY